MDFVVEIFSDYTLRTVALGAAVLGIVSGTLSVFAVLRKQSLLGDAMSHASLPGVVLAFILTRSKEPLVLMTGALIAGWLGALLVILTTSRTRIKNDSALGTVLAVFFGFGMVLMSWLQHQNIASQAGLDKFLFGRAAALVESDVLTMAGVGAVALLLVVLFWKEFKLLSFNPDYAATLGLPVRFLDIMLTTLIVVAVVVGLQTVGVVLMSAMLVAPGASARQWTDRLGVMTILSAAFGALAGVSGALISSSAANLPTGPTIVLAISVIVTVSLLFAPNRGIVWDWARQRRNRRRLRRASVLEALYMMASHHGDPLHPHSLTSLQAGVPGRGVSYTLDQLVSEGLVQKAGEGMYALTPEGIRQASTLYQPFGAETGASALAESEGAV